MYAVFPCCIKNWNERGSVAVAAMRCPKLYIYRILNLNNIICSTRTFNDIAKYHKTLNINYQRMLNNTRWHAQIWTQNFSVTHHGTNMKPHYVNNNYTKADQTVSTFANDWTYSRHLVIFLMAKSMMNVKYLGYGIMY